MSRINPMQGFKAFDRAAVTIASVKLVNRIHKGQFNLGRLYLQSQAAPADMECCALGLTVSAGRCADRAGLPLEPSPLTRGALLRASWLAFFAGNPPLVRGDGFHRLKLQREPIRSASLC